MLKRKVTEEDSGVGGEELKDASMSHAKQLSEASYKAIVSFVDLLYRKRASQSVSPLNEAGQGEKEDITAVSISEEEEPTPWPKRTALKTQFVNDSISELASTDSDWEMSVGDNGEEEDNKLDSMDTMEEDFFDADVHDPEESPLQKKHKAKSSKQGNADGGKGKGDLRGAILQGHSRKQPVVRHT